MDPGAARLPEAIRRAGYELGDVTHVLLSHLHFDHCGWNTRTRRGRAASSPPSPRRATGCSGARWSTPATPTSATAPATSRRTGSRSSKPASAELFGDEAEPIPGVQAVRAPGHNADMCIVLLDGGAEDQKAVFWADLVPTAAHVPYPWIMGYDLYPMTTLENKKLWLPRAAAGDWLCIFEHDPDIPFGRLVEEKPGRYRAGPGRGPAGTRRARTRIHPNPKSKSKIQDPERFRWREKSST